MRRGYRAIKEIYKFMSKHVRCMERTARHETYYSVGIDYLLCVTQDESHS